MTTVPGSASPRYWSGWVGFDVARNKKFRYGTQQGVSFVLNRAGQIRWEGDQAPAGSTGNLLATYPSGFIVSYTSYYELVGSSYTQPGRETWMDTILQGPLSVSGIAQTLAVRVPQNGNGVWNYPASNNPDATRRSLFKIIDSKSLQPISFIARSLEYTFRSNNRIAYEVDITNFTYWVNVVVTLDCNINSIRDNVRVCSIQCLANTDACIQDYYRYCISDDTSPGATRIAAEPCRSFFIKYISEKGSNDIIDRQVRKYCSKYKTLQQLINNDSPIPAAERAADLTVCGCNISAGPGDPEAQQLYDEYFNNLLAAAPTYAAGLRTAYTITKCAFKECSNSGFRPSPIPASGCKNAQCVNIAGIDNSGTVRDVEVNQNCNITESTSTIPITPPPLVPVPTPTTPLAPAVPPTPATPVNPAVPVVPAADKSFLDQYWIYIVVAIVVVVVIIVIVLAVVYGGKSSTPPSSVPPSPPLAGPPQAGAQFYLRT